MLPSLVQHHWTGFQGDALRFAFHLSFSLRPTNVDQPCLHREWDREVDFLAEQQCLCNGVFFEAMVGCTQCLLLHGYVDTTSEGLVALDAALQIAECSPSPPYQPYRNLVPPINTTSVKLSPLMTLGNDRFPSDTAISNYYTPTTTNLLGEITGSAMGRLRSFTATDLVEPFTPTNSPASTANPTKPPAATTTTASGNFGGKMEAQVTAGLLVAALGVVALP